MYTQNPYVSPHIGDNPQSEAWKPSFLFWVAIPAGLFAMLPLLAGIRGILSINAYVKSLPPGEFVCGNPVLGAWACIVIGTPVFAIAGALIGLCGATVAKFINYLFISR